ncbi:MAG: M23 family metallopeptidase [Odoribacter sp.]|nr:M23 family metallopeptidase [Odoribacter sp.]
MISLNGIAQEAVKPVRNAVLLSGNFGELRATHFHSGIDIRTGGVVGWPVICVKDGMLARVNISPVGYGQALYVEHPDGTTTVYGHLDRFAPAITKRVRELQYHQESFRIDEDFRPYQLHFKQGDTIAYSGNTGSSGGPHLHFEVRNTATEHTLNPLLFYSIQDTKAPVVRKLYLYAVAENGRVDVLRERALKATGAGRYVVGRTTVPAGKVGVGLHVNDYMDGSWNRLGVYRMTLTVDGDTLWDLKMDSCSFDQSCFINEVKDFDCYKKRETVYRCFGNYQERFLGIRNRGGGYIFVPEDSVVRVRVDVADINGNRSRVDLELKGGKPRMADEREVLRYDEAHCLELPGCRVELDAGSLFSSVEKQLNVETDSVTGQPVFVLASKDIPLFKKGRMRVDGQFDEHAVICEVDADGRKIPVETTWTPDGLEARIGYLNRYTVVEDREKPQIAYLGKFPGRILRFKITDDLSGIALYRGEVNGKWCLFTYDPRTDVLECSLDEPVFEKGRVNEVKITVADRTGNAEELLVLVESL